MRLALAAACCAVAGAAAADGSLPPSGAPHDVRAFESVVLPQWLRQFQLKNATTGAWVREYSHSRNAVPGVGAPSVYGSSDVLHMLYTVNQLNLSAAERSSWARHVGSFQMANISCWSSPRVPCPGFAPETTFSGFWRLLLGEAGGWEPWHVTASAASALRFLGAFPPVVNGYYDAVARNRSLWLPTVEPLVGVLPGAGCDNFHSCAHKLIGMAASLAMASPTAQADYGPFLEWLAGYLQQRVDNSTGLWCTNVDKSRGRQGLYNCLGGGFAGHMFLHALGAAWPYNRTLQSLALSLQNPDGTWGMPGQSGYMNVDGIYQITRSLPTNPDRAQAAREACDRFLAHVAPTLNNASLFNAAYGDGTHNAFAPIAAVAECQKWFGLVVTDRPWRFSGDAAPFLLRSLPSPAAAAAVSEPQDIRASEQTRERGASGFAPGVWSWACGGASYDGSRPPGAYTSECFHQALSSPPSVMKGWFMRLYWSEIEPEDGEFNWTSFDTNATLAAQLGMMLNPVVFINDVCAECPKGSSTPEWLYKVSPRVLFHRGDGDGAGVGEKGKLESAPYYLDAVFQAKFSRLIHAIASHVVGLPDAVRSKVWAVQAALGITGDSRPWDGTPVNASYVISGPQWVEYCRTMAGVYLGAFAPTGVPVVVNVANPAYNQSDDAWWLRTAAAAGMKGAAVKEGVVSHGYQLNGEAALYNTTGRLLLTRLPDGSYPRARGELAVEPDPTNGTYGNWAVSPWWSLQASAEWALTFGLDVWNLYAGFLGNATFVDTMQFFNRHAAQKDPARATAAFVSFRDALNTDDTGRWPESAFGAVTVDGTGRLNANRMVAIAMANSARGARVDDPGEAASKKSIEQKKGMHLNDVGWQTWAGNGGNYGRYIEQVDPAGTSVGWWRLGPKDQGYGRFARGLNHSLGRTAITLRLDPFFGAAHAGAGGGAAGTVRVAFFDRGSGRWTLRHGSTTVMTVSKQGTDRWVVAEAAASVQPSAPFVISSLHGGDDVFSLVEVLLNTTSTGA